MTRWTTAVLRFRWLVVAGWIALAVTGGVLAPKTIDGLSYEFGLPGQPAYEANERILDTFGSGGVIDPLAVVLSLPPGATVDQPAVRTQYDAALRQLERPGWRVMSAFDAPDALVSEDGRTAVALVYPPVLPGPSAYEAALPQLEAGLAKTEVAGQPLQLTGSEALREGGGGSDRPIIVEIAFGAGGAVIVLILVFGSALAAVPLLMAAGAITTTFLLVLGLSSLTDVSFIVQYLVGLIGLGVAIDYALLVVMRWREERAGGADNTTAVTTAMATAGRAVLFSGVTVAISLLALVVLPVPFLRSVGLGGLLIPLVSVAIALTLLPVILSTVGPRLEWPRRKRVRSGESKLWKRISTTVVRHRVIAAVLATGILIVFFIPALALRLGSPELSAVATGSDPAGQAYRTMVDGGLKPGLLRPVQLLTTEDPRGLVDKLGPIEGVAAVVAPTGGAWRSGDVRMVDVLLEADPSTEDGRAATDRVRAAADGSGTQVGGSPAEDADAVRRSTATSSGCCCSSW